MYKIYQSSLNIMNLSFSFYLLWLHIHRSCIKVESWNRQLKFFVIKWTKTIITPVHIQCVVWNYFTASHQLLFFLMKLVRFLNQSINLSIWILSNCLRAFKWILFRFLLRLGSQNRKFCVHIGLDIHAYSVSLPLLFSSWRLLQYDFFVISFQYWTIFGSHNDECSFPALKIAVL